MFFFIWFFILWKIEKEKMFSQKLDTLSYDKSIDLLLFRLLCILWSFTKCWSKRAFKSFSFIFFTLIQYSICLKEKKKVFLRVLLQTPFLLYLYTIFIRENWVHQQALVWCKVKASLKQSFLRNLYKIRFMTL